MRRSEDHLSPDPDAEAALAVIEATLAGDAVEPEDAELAELTLILADQRPVPRAEFTAALDERVRRRFSAVPAEGRPRRFSRRWLYAPGAMAAVAAAVAVVIVLGGTSHGPTGGSQVPTKTLVPGSAGGRSGSASTAQTTTSASSSAASGAGSPSSSAASGAGSASSSAASGAGSASSSAASGAASPSSSAPKRSSAASSAAPSNGSALSVTAPAPSTSGRQVVQSAQLSLSTQPARVDDVAQQVFDVVSAQKGVVQSSTVTATNSASGYGEFQLTVPSSNLQATMSALSHLHGASVVSRTDGSQDITGEVGGFGRRLAEARALRRSLLRQLGSATTQTQIDSLKAQIRDADTAIADNQAKLNALHHQVDNSQISVTINAALAPGHPSSSGGGFTIGRAAHDAGRVLVVAAGVALIALAVLVPLSLVGAVAAWVGLAVRRRRREQALDLV